MCMYTLIEKRKSQLHNETGTCVHSVPTRLHGPSLPGRSHLCLSAFHECLSELGREGLAARLCTYRP